MNRRARRAAVGPPREAIKEAVTMTKPTRTSDLGHYVLAPLYATALPKGRVPSISRLIR